MRRLFAFLLIIVGLIPFFLILIIGLTAPAAAQQPRSTLNSSVPSVTTGGTFQQLLSAQFVRLALTIQNNNTNGDNCWIFIGPIANATQKTAILLGQGASYQRYYPYVPSDQISGTCATAGDSIYVDTN